jgi:hypothetical protein
MDKHRTVLIEGALYTLSILAIKDEDIERLLKAKESEKDFWEDLEDIENELSGGSILSGFIVGHKASELQVFVGSGDLSIELKSALDNHPFSLTRSNIPFEHNTNYLIYEEWFSNGRFIHSLNDDINLSNLRLKVKEQDFLSGKKRRVLNISYGDEDFEFQESKPEDITLYLIKSNEERVDLI